MSMIFPVENGIHVNNLNNKFQLFHLAVTMSMIFPVENGIHVNSVEIYDQSYWYHELSLL